MVGGVRPRRRTAGRLDAAGRGPAGRAARPLVAGAGEPVDDGSQPIAQLGRAGDADQLDSSSTDAADRRRELRRVDLGEVGELPVHADFDGRFWVGTFADTEDPATGEWQPARIVAVDTPPRTPAPSTSPARQARSPRSIASASAPATPSTTTPPTTTAPTTTAAAHGTGPVRRVRVTDFAYPMRRCEQGFDVLITQTDARCTGLRLETDGYFGPATEQAVRAVPSRPPGSKSTGSSARTRGRRCTPGSASAPSMVTATAPSTRGRWPADCVLDVSVARVGAAPARSADS